MRNKCNSCKKTYKNLAVVLYSRYMINVQNFIQILYLVLSDRRPIRQNIRYVRNEQKIKFKIQKYEHKVSKCHWTLSILAFQCIYWCNNKSHSKNLSPQEH